MESSVSKWRWQGHRVPSLGSRQEEEAVPAVHGPSPSCRAATGKAAVSRLASAWVTKALGEVSGQFSEVWSRVGLVVAEVRVPGGSQAAVPCRSWRAAPLTRHETGTWLGHRGPHAREGCRPQCLNPGVLSSRPLGHVGPAAQLCSAPASWGRRASVPGRWGSSPRTSETERPGHQAPGASGRWISDVSTSVFT